MQALSERFFHPVTNSFDFSAFGMPGRASPAIDLSGNPAFLGLSADDLLSAFSPGDYLSANPDIAGAGADPFRHYVEHGWREERAPFAGFDPVYYRRRHMEDDRRICPLAHYVRHGRASSLPTAPAPGEDADPAPWRVLNGEVLRKDWATGIAPMGEALGPRGARLLAEGLGPRLLALFAPETQRARDGLAPEAGLTECLWRYLTRDFFRDISPGPYFDPGFYRARALAANLPPFEAGETALEHWVRLGAAAGIVPTPLFDIGEYLTLNPDSGRFPGGAFQHFVLHGQYEGRQFLRDAHLPAARGGKRRGAPPARAFAGHLADFPAAMAEFEALRKFRSGGDFSALVAAAAAIEPAIGAAGRKLTAYLPPWHDVAFGNFARLMTRLPAGSHPTVVLVPAVRMGGADVVASLLARTLREITGSVLVLQTDTPLAPFGDWFDDLPIVDISPELSLGDERLRSQMLCHVLRRLGAREVFNVNSRTAFETFRRYGARLARHMRLHAYYFCADRDADGVPSGYPVHEFAGIFEHLATAMTDGTDLAEELAQRFHLDSAMRARLRVVYVPPRVPLTAQPLAAVQHKRAGERARPRFLWAGRLDRQKRFDLVQEVARAMPEADFLCWGKAVLDAPPETSDLPSNMVLNPPYERYDELPLSDFDGYFYTSDWDGIPSILIDFGAMGMPVVATTAGGVGELIDETTGWTVPAGSGAGPCVAALRSMLQASPTERTARARALQARVASRHAVAGFAEALRGILAGGERT